MRSPLFLAALLLSAPVGASDVYKCQRGDTTLYSHTPCSPEAKPLDLPRIGILGSARDHEAVQAIHKALRDMPTPQGSTRQASRQDSPSQRRLSYGERMTLRKLEIEADGLARDIQKWSRSSSYRRALEEEYRMVKARIRELRARL